jgi:hypothetical protein
MLRKLTPLFLIASLLVIASCHKSNSAAPGNPAQLVGNYQFLYVSVSVQAITQASGAGQTEKTISNSNYKTIDNSGTVTFTKDSIAWKGIGYTADYNAFVSEYLNGVLSDTLSYPITLTLDPVNSTTKYDVIGQDSLYVHGGYPTAGIGGGTTIAPPSGGIFSFKGDTLFLTSKVNQTNPPQTMSGVTITTSANGVAVMALLKQ